MIIVLIAGFMSWAYIHGLLPGNMKPDPDLVEYMKNTDVY